MVVLWGEDLYSVCYWYVVNEVVFWLGVCKMVVMVVVIVVVWDWIGVGDLCWGYCVSFYGFWLYVVVVVVLFDDLFVGIVVFIDCWVILCLLWLLDFEICCIFVVIEMLWGYCCLMFFGFVEEDF